MCEIGEMAQERKRPFAGRIENIRFKDIESINSDMITLHFTCRHEEREIIKISEFLKIVRKLSRMIPKISDESLLVIDDILYENDKESHVQEHSDSKSNDLDYLNIKEYNNYYMDFINRGFRVRELDNIYVRLAENLGGEHFAWISWHLGCSREESKICLFLKIFKSWLSAKTDKAMSAIKDCAVGTGFSFLLIKLRKFPQLSNTDNRRIVDFIVYQADACLKSFESDTKNLKKPKEFIKDSLVCFDDWDYVWPSHYQHVLHDVFMSAKDVNEKKEFLMVFVEALHRLSRGKGSINDGFGSIFKSLSNNLISVSRYIVEKHFEEDMRSINQEYGYNIEPYWSELPKDAKDHHEKINKLDVMATTNSPSKSEVLNRNQMVAKYVRVSDVDTEISEHFHYDDFIKDLKLECDAEYHLSKYPASSPCQPLRKSDEDSFSKVIDTQECYCKSSSENLQDKATDSSIIKKFLIYDDFMKCLHLMSILHIAFTKYEVLYEDAKAFHKDEVSHANEPIYDNECFACTRLTGCDMLYSDVKNKKVSWPLEMAVTKCPFLYFKPSAYHLKEKYLMYLKGERIDEAAEREIFPNLF